MCQKRISSFSIQNHKNKLQPFVNEATQADEIFLRYSKNVLAFGIVIKTCGNLLLVCIIGSLLLWKVPYFSSLIATGGAAIILYNGNRMVSRARKDIEEVKRGRSEIEYWKPSSNLGYFKHVLVYIFF